jgi:hypothetical protein
LQNSKTRFKKCNPSSIMTGYTKIHSSFMYRNTIFNDFVMKYAAAEDHIRVLWEQLLKTHQKFMVTSYSSQ